LSNAVADGKRRRTWMESEFKKYRSGWRNQPSRRDRPTGGASLCARCSSGVVVDRLA